MSSIDRELAKVQEILRAQEKELRPSTEQRVVYLLAGLLTSLVPVYLFTVIFGVPLQDNAPVFAVVSLAAAAVLTFGYHNVAYQLKLKLTQSRGELITINNVKSTPAGKDRKQYLEELRQQQGANSGKEAVAFSVLYNNLVFLLVSVVLTFYVLHSASSIVNYILSVTLAAAGVTLLSAASLR